MKLSSRTIWSNHYPSFLMVQLARLCTVAEHASKPERRLSCTVKNKNWEIFSKWKQYLRTNVILKNNCSLMFAGSHILYATGVRNLPYGNVSENLSSVWRTRWFTNHGESVRYTLPWFATINRAVNVYNSPRGQLSNFCLDFITVGGTEKISVKEYKHHLKGQGHDFRTG